MTPEKAIEQLEKMQSQIIHGSNVFGEIAQVIRDLQKHKPPVPEIEGHHPVVLYFKTEEEALDFEAMVKDSNPNLKVRQL